MMKQQKTYRWMTAAGVMAVSMLTVPPASGQTQGAAAMFEGRPAMAGAQGGQGAQAGLPQGGLGVQGSENQKGLNLRKPSGLDALPAVPRDPGVGQVGVSPNDITPKKDVGIAREQRSGTGKVKRAARRVVERSNNKRTDGSRLSN